MTANKQDRAGNDQRSLRHVFSHSFPRKNETQRRSEHNKDAALPVYTDSPADARGRQSDRGYENCSLDACVSQKTETKEW
jgi:hypothetical protein